MSLVFLVIMALVLRWKDFRRLYARIVAPAPAASGTAEAG